MFNNEVRFWLNIQYNINIYTHDYHNRYTLKWSDKIITHILYLVVIYRLWALRIYIHTKHNVSNDIDMSVCLIKRKLDKLMQAESERYIYGVAAFQMILVSFSKRYCN